MQPKTIPSFPASSSGCYYVYIHTTLDGNVFYVGKGTGNRDTSREGRNPHWHEKAVNGYNVQRVKEGMNEEEAFYLEGALIFAYRSEIVNLTGVPKKQRQKPRKTTISKLAKEVLDQLAIPPKKKVAYVFTSRLEAVCFWVFVRQQMSERKKDRVYRSDYYHGKKNDPLTDVLATLPDCISTAIGSWNSISARRESKKARADIFLLTKKHGVPKYVDEVRVVELDLSQL